jgi:hypothetical protein
MSELESLREQVRIAGQEIESLELRYHRAIRVVARVHWINTDPEIQDLIQKFVCKLPAAELAVWKGVRIP